MLITRALHELPQAHQFPIRISCVASAYECKALPWPPIKAEDCTALNKFAIFLSSCKNALPESQYASKFEQPGNIQKLIFKFPVNMRERWRCSAEDIMESQLGPVEFNDIVAFMDREARIATNPVFGNISASQPPNGVRSSEPKTTIFAIQVKINQSTNSEKNLGADLADLASSDVPSIVCIFCQQNHALEDCHLLRWKPYQERIKFLSAKRLCFGCLWEKHVPRLCPERKICKIPNCTSKHPTVLHTSNIREKSSVDVGVGTGDGTDTTVLNAMANAGECSSSLDLGEAHPRTAMTVILVKICSKSSNKTIITCAFLDNGSSATFCTESLMRKLGVHGTKVKISRSTLEKKTSPVNSYLIRDLVVSDLDENHFVHLPMPYTRPEIPPTKNDIPTQEDVDQWPDLDGVFIPQVDAEIGLLIAGDVPKALDPNEVKHSQNGGPYDPNEVKHTQNGGPYATRTRMGWANLQLVPFKKGSRLDPALSMPSFYGRIKKPSLISVEEMKRAEKAILKNVQQTAFPAEVHQLIGPGDSKHVRRSSPLFKLDPVLRNGLLRVGGRLSCASISLDAKHQIILPKNNHVSSLTIIHYHTLSSHSGRRQVLSLLRQKYWVIKGNSAANQRKLHKTDICCRNLPFFSQQSVPAITWYLPSDEQSPTN
ncbi:hypothetical protein P5673_010560 [Acropora cervicornis]|uniref:Uncharacterized protein n=1 Tax=Acropora cervicornis TaxID=6130 RepID=A0AAD9V998_ACRCE|nr:hypothetical protein P5673_010560 [Acropora cervicornis]